MARRPPIDDPRAVTAHTSGIAHVVELIRHTVPPMHPAGLPFVAAAGGVAVAGRRHRWIRTPAAATALACAAFFRHPDRVPPSTPGAVVAPADGEITLVDTATPPAELGWPDLPLPRVSTFLSLLDVHVQRSPSTGTVTRSVHTPGSFLSADLPAASEQNERQSMAIRTEGGQEIAVVQIAGLLARRIVCDPESGDRLSVGETYGLIRFGSRVDVYLPARTELLVRPGQRAVGGETVFATLPSTDGTGSDR
ncbi:phosphatidylserine decarboxylase [Williamsia sterculiae]|uniref:Phosphatidylserine decarboxylase proenzyme n=1 Tax=Williamsia sterculiae TaxID=1344003 RepID=A0A1N7EZY3_9NOCA|nr:phosphatidylserine decarboxylase [Williamsia sterculiae]SIR93630.1 phosphatidylserine decarboxylase [Williamsia sterculiae]